MTTSIIKNKFSGQLPYLDFIATISNEVATYSELMKKVGSSIPLVFDEDVKIILTSNNIKKLLEESIAYETSSINLSYICDCITLSEVLEYSGDAVQYVVFELADPEINGGYKSRDEILVIINQLC